MFWKFMGYHIKHIYIPISSIPLSLSRRNVDNILLLLIGDRKYVDCSPAAPFFICSTKKSPF